MTQSEALILHNKILDGIKLSYIRLLESRAKYDGELIISRNGEIVSVKARDLIKEQYNVNVNNRLPAAESSGEDVII